MKSNNPHPQTEKEGGVTATLPLPVTREPGDPLDDLGVQGKGVGVLVGAGVRDEVGVLDGLLAGRELEGES